MKSPRRSRAHVRRQAGLFAVFCLTAALAERVARADSVPQQPSAAMTPSVDAQPETPAGAADDERDSTAEADGEPAALPPGHPPIDSDPGENRAMHSPVGSLSSSSGLPPGVLEVHVVNPSNEPVPHATLTLQAHRESVSEGNTDRSLNATTNERGIARFEQLTVDSAISYRLLLHNGPAKYGPQPFQLVSQQGMLATVRQLELVRDLRRALVAADAMIFVEPRDSVFQFEVLYRIYNVGQSVWLPDDVQVDLPSDRQAVTTPATGDDVQLETSAHGVRFKGAVIPGQHQLSFTFQVPRHNSSFASFEVGLPPNVMQARVGVASNRNTELSVDGFQEARATASQSGQRMLVAGQTFDRVSRPPSELRFEIRGLPTLGAGRVVAAVIAASLTILALAYALFRHRKQSEHGPKALEQKARARLLEELAELESAHATGTIGPRTYEDTRTTLVEALVRLEPASG